MTAAFLERLDVAVVRRAWRRIAVASHPDAVRRGGGRAVKHDGSLFIEASQAYELLMGHLLRKPAAPGSPRRAADPARSHPPAKPAGGSALFYHGPVPRRRLRLAEFLYYTGRVSWQSLIGAIVWQRAAQPRFGELARELRSISAQDLQRILGSRLRHEHTGETARRLNLLTTDEVERILRLQRARRRPIGRYFLEKESMTAAQLTTPLRELYRHNGRWSRTP
jgi:hypothetical protein